MMRNPFFAIAACVAFSCCLAQETVYPFMCWTYMQLEEQTRSAEQIVKDATSCLPTERYGVSPHAAIDNFGNMVGYRPYAPCCAK